MSIAPARPRTDGLPVEAHHHVRDITFGEDTVTSRTGNGAANLATIRAVIIAAIKDAGYLHVPEGRRDHTTVAGITSRPPRPSASTASIRTDADIYGTHRSPASNPARSGHLQELREGRVRLVGAALTEQNDEWTEARRYMGPEILAAGKKGRNTTETNANGVTAEAIDARIDIDHEVAFSYITSWDVALD